MMISLTQARAGIVATKAMVRPRSTSCNIRSCSALGGTTGRLFRIGVATSAGQMTQARTPLTPSSALMVSVSAAPLAHAVEDSVTAVKHAIQVGPHHLFPRLGRECRPAAVGNVCPGAVDQDVDAAKLLLDGGSDPGHSLLVGDVELTDIDRAASLADQRRRLAERRLRAT